MGIVYDEKPRNAKNLRLRAAALLEGRFHTPSETRNNINMLVNMLGHTMLNLADALDRIEKLEEKAYDH